MPEVYLKRAPTTITGATGQTRIPNLREKKNQKKNKNRDYHGTKKYFLATISYIKALKLLT